jgi:hypothetical protein
MPQLIAIVRQGKIAQINVLKTKDIEASGGNDPTFRLVDISRRPDIKLGTPWPPTRDPNDLIQEDEGHYAVVQGGKVLQVVAPAHIDPWWTHTTAGASKTYRQRLKHNPHADPTISVQPIPEGATVKEGDSWPPPAPPKGA